MIGVVAGQLREIRADPALRYYGSALALTHALTMWYWRQTDAVGLVARGSEAICWPLVSGCETLRVLTVEPVAWLLRGYFVAGIGIAALFCIRRFATAAYAGLAALTLFKLLFLALDFRLRLNQHYMMLWISAVFLVVPSKRDALRVLLVLFYVGASTLKFNADWISGAALPTRSWVIPAALTGAACVYLIILELCVSWGLLAANRWVFWGALVQFVVFHAVSWQQVGFFFPTVMFLLLTIFPLARLVPPGVSERSLLSRLIHLRLRPAIYGVMLAFSLMQLPPLLIPGDAAITGEGRPYALHMVDAGVVCRGRAMARRADGSTVEVVLSGATAARIACDPIVVAGRARNICRHASGLVTDVVELDLLLVSRRRSAARDETVIDLPGFCARNIRYNPFGKNWWIK
jgi:hypothetical protein